MTEIEPGTPVRVVIEGNLAAVSPAGTQVIHTERTTVPVAAGDPAVTVRPLDPERPTLDLETLARTISESVGGYPKDTRPIQDAAKAVLALIQAAHPEWTP